MLGLKKRNHSNIWQEMGGKKSENIANSGDLSGCDGIEAAVS